MVSRRLVNQAQVASVSHIVQVEADESSKGNENVGPQQAHVALNNMPSRILRDIECHLNGTYWTAPVGPLCRAVA